MKLMLRHALITTITLATTFLFVSPANALDQVKFMIGANPGGGYDQTARGLGKAMMEAGTARGVQFENKGGAGGTIGLAQFVSSGKGDASAMIVTGAVMVGAIVQSKPPVTLAQATPIARLFYEYNVFVVPANSPIKTMKDVVDLLKKDASAVKWGGGSRGSVDHISIAQLAKLSGVDPTKINYVPFQGGGEASAAILGGHVTIGTSGWNEMAQYVKSGEVRALAVTSANRLPGENVPTLKELGIALEAGNWRGVYGAPGLTVRQRTALIDAVVAATKQKSWIETLVKNDWFPALLTGDDFGKFVDEEHKRLEVAMRAVGLVR